MGHSVCRARNLAAIKLDAGEQAEHYSGHCCVNSTLEEAVPGEKCNRHVEPRRAKALSLREVVENKEGNCADEPAEVESVRVEDGDDDDGTEIVHDCESEQESTQGKRKHSPDDREHGKGKRDVGCHRDAPAAGCAISRGDIHDHEDRGRQDHSAKRGSDRHHCLGRLRESAQDEFVLELEPGDEEEHGEQSIGSPGAQTQVEPERFWAYLEVDEICIGVTPGRVCPDQCDDCHGEQQDSADGFVTKLTAQPLALEQGWARKDLLSRHGFTPPSVSSKALPRSYS